VPAVSHFVTDYSAQLHGPHHPEIWPWYWEQNDDLDVPGLIAEEPYLVLEYVGGSSLREAIHDSSRWDEQGLGEPNSRERARAAAKLGRELVGILGELHTRRPNWEAGRDTSSYFVHQDIKPDNLIRTRVRDHYLIDLGLVGEVIVTPDGDDGGRRHRQLSGA
jgi:serine/threonine protein kinase